MSTSSFFVRILQLHKEWKGEGKWHGDLFAYHSLQHHLNISLQIMVFHWDFLDFLSNNSDHQLCIYCNEQCNSKITLSLQRPPSAESKCCKCPIREICTYMRPGSKYICLLEQVNLHRLTQQGEGGRKESRRQRRDILGHGEGRSGTRAHKSEPNSRILWFY